ncbi:MAG: hypothetical protein AB7P03_17240 [Kofleriaceae bacterium]
MVAQRGDAVRARFAGSARLLAVTTAWLVLLGCEPVDGGAVELSWKLRPAGASDERFLSCSPAGTGRIERMRLDWVVGEVAGTDSWDCEDNAGVTGFDLPEGDALLSVVPMCAGGPAAPNTYTAPAPERRRVVTGDTVSMGAVELVLEVADCASQPCICTPFPLELAVDHTPQAR